MNVQNPGSAGAPLGRFPRAAPEPSTRSANLALGLDAAFCNIAGLVFTLAGAFMADWLGVAGWIATVFGIVVLLWSFVVTLFANRRNARRHELDIVMRVNVVVGLGGLLLAALGAGMTGAGRVVVLVGAAVVLAFALAQFLVRDTTA